MLETIYNDFTTQVLPKISEGLIITKEYFFDLFGRYIKYLIIIDGLSVIISSLILFIGIFLFYKGIKIAISKNWLGSGFPEAPLILIGGLSVVLISLLLFEKVIDLTKDIYIPEIRVYEQLQIMMKK